MNHAIAFHPEADRELTSLYNFIADRDGPERAWRYIIEIREFCDRLRMFPKRGTERKKIARGLRVVGFKRRCSVAFIATETTVVILGIFYAGKNISADTLERRLRSTP